MKLLEDESFFRCNIVGITIFIFLVCIILFVFLFFELVGLLFLLLILLFVLKGMLLLVFFINLIFLHENVDRASIDEIEVEAVFILSYNYVFLHKDERL